jgi:hypothetical protein
LLAASVAGAVGVVALPVLPSTAAPAGVYVDVGGDGYVDADGVRWAADAGATGGRLTSTRARIAGTGNDRLYQTGRFGMSGYSVPLPAAGRYTVTLHFAETFWKASGKRVFAVTAEGSQLASNLDVYAAAGGRNRAYQLKAAVSVPDGRLDLGFSATVNRPILQGIEAVRASGGSRPAPSTPTPTPTPPTPPAPPAPPASGATRTIAAAGDVSCDPGDPDFNGGAGKDNACRQKATSDLLVGRKLDAVLVPGDIQYDKGQLSNFRKVYDPTWGRVKSITRPVPGNHEYDTKGAVGYYDYFGSLAGPAGKGFYSFELGNWHLIGLNSECYYGADCAAEQERWLEADLARNAKACTLAYWHHPRFSSGDHGNDTNMSELWKAMYDNKVEVVLNGTTTTTSGSRR